jgi:hypothetical protein
MARTLKTSGPGHNSGGMIDRDALEREVEAAAGLMREMQSIAEDLKERCKAADDAGVCSRKELRRLARESLMDQDVLTAQLERMDTLRHVLGQLQDTPLGNAAVKSVGKRRPRDSEDETTRDDPPEAPEAA